MLRQESQFRVQSVAVRVLPCDLSSQNIRFRLSRLNPCPRFQASHYRQRISPLVGFLGQRKRSEQIDMCAGRKNCRKVKRGGQDSDHGCVGIVQTDRFARNVRIGSKAPFPQSVTEHHYMRTIPFAFLRAKLSSHLRLHAQQREEVLRYRDRA